MSYNLSTEKSTRKQIMVDEGYVKNLEHLYESNKKKDHSAVIMHIF